MKVCVVTTNRADFSKLEPLVKALHQDDFFELQLVVTGSHLLSKFSTTVNKIAEKYPITERMYTLIEGDSLETMVSSVGMSLIKFSSTFAKFQPDVVVVHGDRFDAFGACSAASMMNICVVHIEGGELSGTVDGSLRHAITKLSHYHFVTNHHSQIRVQQMGEIPSSIFLTGCPSYDQIFENSLKENLPTSNDPWIDIFRGLNAEVPKFHFINDINPMEYVVCMYHPNTVSVELSVQEYSNLLHALCDLGKPVLLFYPNVDPGNQSLIKVLHRIQLENNHILHPITSVDMSIFVRIMQFSAMMVGNSSACVRESCVFGVPTVVIGKRQTGRYMPRNVTLSDGLNREELLTTFNNIYGNRLEPEYYYGDGHSVEKMIHHLKNDIDVKKLEKPFQDL